MLENDVLKKIKEIQPKIYFDDLLHEYRFKGNDTISVTQLLKKAGIGKDYSNVPEWLLEPAQERGNIVHNDIEQHINCCKDCQTPEGNGYFNLIENAKLKPIWAEFKVGNDVVCGKVDTILTDKDGQLYIDDHKTGTTFDELSVRWQGSLYAYLLGLYDEVAYILCSHLPKSLKFGLYRYEKIPKKDIEELIERERNGEIMPISSKKTTTELNDIQQSAVNVQKTILFYKKQIEELEKQQSEYNSAILTAMRENNVKSLECGNITFTRVAESTRSSIDSKKLKAEMPEIAEKYTKQTKIGESLRITIKE